MKEIATKIASRLLQASVISLTDYTQSIELIEDTLRDKSSIIKDKDGKVVVKNSSGSIIAEQG